MIIKVTAYPGRDLVGVRFPDGFQESMFLMAAQEARDLAKALELASLALSMGAELDVSVTAQSTPC